MQATSQQQRVNYMQQQAEPQVLVEQQARDSQGAEQIPMSQTSAAEEYCPVHSDLFVAFDKKKNELVCNQCIYHEVEDVQKALGQLTFTSYVASSLKELFDEKFTAYKTSLQDMNKVAPKVISQTLESTVNKFFDSVDTQISEVEQGVLTKIHTSTNLKELEELLCRKKDGFGLELEKLYEQNRLEIDGHVQKGCYSSVVSKKAHYEDLIGKMRGNHEKMQRTVEEGQRKIERIMTIKQQHETDVTIGKRLHEIVDSCLEIDLAQAKSAYKRQKMDGEQAQQAQDLQRQQLAAQNEAAERQRVAEAEQRQRNIELQKQQQFALERKQSEEAAAALERDRVLRIQQEWQAAAMRAKQEAEERARREAEERARLEVQERVRREAEALAQAEAERQRIAQEQEKARAAEELRRKLEADAEAERQAEIARQQQLQLQQQQEIARQQQQQELLAQQQQYEQQQWDAAQAAELQKLRYWCSYCCQEIKQAEPYLQEISAFADDAQEDGDELMSDPKEEVPAGMGPAGDFDADLALDETENCSICDELIIKMFMGDHVCQQNSAFDYYLTDLHIRKNWKPIDQNSLSYLPRSRYRGQAAAGAGNGDFQTDDERQCPICMTDYVKGEVILTLTCFHIFHPDCIECWLMSRNQCPICDTQIN